jgi:hypothetical protein
MARRAAEALPGLDRLSWEAIVEILDQYVSAAPSPQSALDIFKGEWGSKLPPEAGPLEAGQWTVFEDQRVRWGLERLGGVASKEVLELGPHEGGHSYMLQHAKAASVVAVEANTRAYLKCLIVKEVLGLDRVHFLCGDFVEYLRLGPRKFDVCFASGVLYHMTDPIELIGLLSRTADRLYLWTHYFDRQQMTPDLARRFAEGQQAEREGFAHTLYRQQYGDSLTWQGFCGGAKRFSNWMSKDDILGALRHFGYTQLEVAFPAPDHPYGPNCSVVAIRA